ncbi:MAG: hypothetical protein JXQ75_17190 [Phycisphaerae bacterium]|nr:hypothetical protein [Phycisphaerae bacterium]
MAYLRKDGSCPTTRRSPRRRCEPTRSSKPVPSPEPVLSGKSVLPGKPIPSYHIARLLEAQGVGSDARKDSLGNDANARSAKRQAGPAAKRHDRSCYSCAVLKEAKRHIDLAVEGLREANNQDDLPRGLLARAELHLFTGDHAEARADLNEALDIATRDAAGWMKLHVTDCHLGFARLALAEGDREAADRRVAAARELIEETGCHRREEELRTANGE